MSRVQASPSRNMSAGPRALSARASGGVRSPPWGIESRDGQRHDAGATAPGPAAVPSRRGSATPWKPGPV